MAIIILFNPLWQKNFIKDICDPKWTYFPLKHQTLLLTGSDSEREIWDYSC